MRIRAWSGFLLFGVAATVAYFLSRGLTQSVIYDVIGLAGVAAMVVGVRIHRPEARLPWYLLAAGQLLFVLGDMLWTLFEQFLHIEPFPSVADAVYLAAYPLCAAGLLLFVRRMSPRSDRASLIDAAIVTIGFGVVSWVFWMDRIADDTSLSFLQLLISVAYPMADLLLLAVVARLAIAPGARSPAYWILSVSFGVLLVADVIYALLNFAGSYYSGHPADALWLASYVLLGAAALHPSMRQLTEQAPDRLPRLSRGRLAMLMTASLTAPVVLGIQSARSVEVNVAVIVGGSVALFLLVIARVAELLREVETKVHELAEQGRKLNDALENEQRAAAELRRLNQLKEEFAAIVSHEIRTPLTTIIGFAKTLLRPEIAEDPALRDESLRAVERQGNRLLRLVENLLTASRLESERLTVTVEAVPFEDMCREVVDGLTGSTGRVALKLPASLPVVYTDRGLLSRVMTNLIDNALKYSPKGMPCEFGARVEGSSITFWVGDRGPGIPRQELGRIFDRFYQSESPGERRSTSVGLGLSLVRDLVVALGGTIRVESGEGEGSTFTVILPIGHPDGERRAAGGPNRDSARRPVLAEDLA